MPIQVESVFQVPSEAVEMTVAVHFYEESKASILLSVNAAGTARNFCEVQFFAFYLARQLATLGNPEDAMLAQILADISVAQLRQIGRDIEIVSYPGHEAKKQLFANCAIRADTSSFYFDTKGFGLLGRGIGYYSPASVFVFLRTLVEKHADEESYLIKLRDVCRLGGIFHLTGQLTIANQSERAFQMGGSLLSEFTLDDRN